MALYSELLARIGAPINAIRIYEGEVYWPDSCTTNPVVFPPALMPIWVQSTGSIVGYWRHIDEIQRPISIVQFSNWGRYCLEIATNFDQLLQSAFVDIIFESDDLTVSRLAMELNVSIDELLSHAATYGQDTVELLRLSSFNENQPLACFEHDTTLYRGSFPHEKMVLTSAALRRICSFEVHSWNSKNEDEFKSIVQNHHLSPIWLASRNQSENFARLLDEGDLGGAWLALNSSGWHITDAISALKRLSECSSDQIIGDLCSAWANVKFPTDYY